MKKKMMKKKKKKKKKEQEMVVDEEDADETSSSSLAPLPRITTLQSIACKTRGKFTVRPKKKRRRKSQNFPLTDQSPRSLSLKSYIIYTKHAVSSHIERACDFDFPVFFFPSYFFSFYLPPPATDLRTTSLTS